LQENPAKLHTGTRLEGGVVHVDADVRLHD